MPPTIVCPVSRFEKFVWSTVLVPGTLFPVGKRTRAIPFRTDPLCGHSTSTSPSRREDLTTPAPGPPGRTGVRGPVPIVQFAFVV